MLDSARVYVFNMLRFHFPSLPEKFSPKPIGSSKQGGHLQWAEWGVAGHRDQGQGVRARQSEEGNSGEGQQRWLGVVYVPGSNKEIAERW